MLLALFIETKIQHDFNYPSPANENYNNFNKTGALLKKIQ